MFSASARAEGFLSKSRLLGLAGVEIAPAQQTSDGLVLPVDQSERSERKLFLTTAGNYALAPVASAKERKLHVRTCGGDELARPWKSSKPIKGRGYFVATGEGIDSLELKWLGATKTSAPAGLKCLSKTSKLSVARVKTLQGNILFLADFKSPDAACEYERLQRVGLLRGGECDVLLESKIDCDGRGYNGGSFGRPLGILEITRGDESERWLVFEASGYEGDAYLGIRLTTDRPPAEKDVDFYVYSGC